VHACLDAFEGIVDSAARSKSRTRSGLKWPSTLVLGEGKQSRVDNSKRNGGKTKTTTRRPR
jgi:hypothetical protein